MARLPVAGQKTALRDFHRHRRRSRLLPQSPGHVRLASGSRYWLRSPWWFAGRARDMLTQVIGALLPVEMLIGISSILSCNFKSWISLICRPVGCLGATPCGELLAGKKIPQRVVIDEVSGQHLTLLFGMRQCRCGGKPRTSVWPTSWSIGFVSTQIRPQLEIFAGGFYTFSVVRHLEAVLRRGRRKRCRAVGASWRMIGSREFTRELACGWRVRRVCSSLAHHA